MKKITHKLKTSREIKQEDIIQAIGTFGDKTKSYDKFRDRKLKEELIKKEPDFIEFLNNAATLNKIFLYLKIQIYTNIFPFIKREKMALKEAKKIIRCLKKICRIGFTDETRREYKNYIKKYSNQILTEYEHHTEIKDWEFMGIPLFEDYSRNKIIVDTGKYLRKYGGLSTEFAPRVTNLLKKDYSVSDVIKEGFEGAEKQAALQLIEYIDEIIIYKRRIYSANKRIIKLTKVKKKKEKLQKENAKRMTEILYLEDKNDELRKKLGLYSQYFRAWGSESRKYRKGEKKNFYENEFKIDKPELKKYSYDKFINNLKSSESQKRKALRQRLTRLTHQSID